MHKAARLVLLFVLPCALCCSLVALRAFFGSAPISTAPNQVGPHGRWALEFNFFYFFYQNMGIIYSHNLDKVTIPE